MPDTVRSLCPRGANRVEHTIKISTPTGVDIFIVRHDEKFIPPEVEIVSGVPKIQRNRMVLLDFYMNLFEFQLLKHSATGQSFLGDSLDLQTTLHDLTGRFLVLIKGMGINIQRGRRLAVSEQSSNCADIRAAGDEQACRCVAQAVDVQISRQIVCQLSFSGLSR